MERDEWWKLDFLTGAVRIAISLPKFHLLLTVTSFFIHDRCGLISFGSTSPSKMRLSQKKPECFTNDLKLIKTLAV